MKNLEPYIGALQAALIGDTELGGTEYLRSREIPYRIIMRNGILQTTKSAQYNNTRLNLMISGGWITQVCIG